MPRERGMAPYSDARRSALSRRSMSRRILARDDDDRKKTGSNDGKQGRKSQDHDDTTRVVVEQGSYLRKEDADSDDEDDCSNCKRPPPPPPVKPAPLIFPPPTFNSPIITLTSRPQQPPPPPPSSLPEINQTPLPPPVANPPPPPPSLPIPTTITVTPTTPTPTPTTVNVVVPVAAAPAKSVPALNSPPADQEPRKGLGSPPTTPTATDPALYTFLPVTLSPQPTAAGATALPNSLTTPTASPNDGRPGKGHDHDGEQRGLSPAAEHALISIGSIGAFILVCFVCWIGWRTMRKSKRKGATAGADAGGAVDGDGSDTENGSRGPLPDRLVARIPFLRDRQRGWEGLDEAGLANLPPPSYREKASMMGPAATAPGAGYYAPDVKSVPFAGPSRANTGDALMMNLNAGGTMNTMMSNNAAMNNTMNSMNTLGSAGMPYGHQPHPSFGSMRPMDPYGGTLTTDPDGTLRFRMSDAFFNQSELARQPSNAYDPDRRLVYRASELSSLSSGFGDGDIIIPDNYVQPPQPASTNPPQSIGRFSWMSRSGGGSATRRSSFFNTGSSSQRDTIYTQNSEDMPARFRSVSSWVNQQTGRVKRSQQRAANDADAPPVPQLPGQPGVPGIHNPPAEQRFDLMMSDGETPRRVEDVIGNVKMS